MMKKILCLLAIFFVISPVNAEENLIPQKLAEQQAKTIYEDCEKKISLVNENNVIIGNIAEGSEVNRTDIFGYNAIMSVILNENMEDDTKLQTIQMLIDKGVDVNWLNIQGETALTLALERIELDIANLLLDNGAVLYKN